MLKTGTRFQYVDYPEIVYTVKNVYARECDRILCDLHVDNKLEPHSPRVYELKKVWCSEQIGKILILTATIA